MLLLLPRKLKGKTWLATIIIIIALARSGGAITIIMIITFIFVTAVAVSRSEAPAVPNVRPPSLEEPRADFRTGLGDFGLIESRARRALARPKCARLLIAPTFPPTARRKSTNTRAASCQLPVARLARSPARRLRLSARPEVGTMPRLARSALFYLSLARSLGLRLGPNSLGAPESRLANETIWRKYTNSGPKWRRLAGGAEQLRDAN